MTAVWSAAQGRLQPLQAAIPIQRWDVSITVLPQKQPRYTILNLLPGHGPQIRGINMRENALRQNR